MTLPDLTYLGNPLTAWLLAAGIATAVVILLLVATRIISRRLGAVATRTRIRFDDLLVEMLRHSKTWFLVLIGVYAGTWSLALPDTIGYGLRSVMVIAVLVQAGIWAGLAINFYVQGYRQRRLQEDPGAVTTLGALGLFGKIIVWVLVLLLALDNLGVDVTALVAGLGVGGIAVALAVQNILGDLLASLSIVLDKPFVVGDFIAIDEHLGSIEYVGLKTTRLRSLSGEQLVFSNSDLLSSRIHNYGRMFERRVVFAINIAYETPRDRLETIPGILRAAVERQEDTRFDRAHFMAYGDFALKFEIVYYVRTPDYNRYMDIQQAINFYLLEQFEQQGIKFAYPTRTLWLKDAAASGSVGDLTMQTGDA